MLRGYIFLYGLHPCMRFFNIDQKCIILLSLGKVPKTGWGGGALFRAAFGRAWVPPPIFGGTWVHPPIWDDHLVSPPIPDELLPSPPFPKIYFFKKCVCAMRHFYIPQIGMMLLSLRYFFIKNLLFEWLKVQTNWVGWLKPWNCEICGSIANFLWVCYPSTHFQVF